MEWETTGWMQSAWKIAFPRSLSRVAHGTVALSTRFIFTDDFIADAAHWEMWVLFYYYFLSFFFWPKRMRTQWGDYADSSLVDRAVDYPSLPSLSSLFFVFFVQPMWQTIFQRFSHTRFNLSTHLFQFLLNSFIWFGRASS